MLLGKLRHRPQANTHVKSISELSDQISVPSVPLSFAPTQHELHNRVLVSSLAASRLVIK